MTIFEQIAGKIIKEQELVIGPLAWTEAGKVSGVEAVNKSVGEVRISDTDPKGLVDKLVGRYERIFGPASRAVCKDAVASLLADLPSAQVPLSLA